MDLRLLYLTFHVVGIITWVGSLPVLASILAARALEGDATFREKLGALAKQAGRTADIGAALAILGGIGVLSQNAAFYMHQPWMHAKLTLVLVLLGGHGFLRAKGKRGGAIPSFVVPVITLAAVAIVALAVLKPGGH